MEELGKRIRQERLKRGYTIRELAEYSGLSKGFISLIERDKAHPSITSLKKIAQFFGISVVGLFGIGNDTDEKAEVNRIHDESTSFENLNKNKINNYIDKIEIVRNGSRKKLIFSYSSIEYEMVTPDMQRKLQILHLKLNPGDTSGEKPFPSGIGEKCALVLKGTLEYIIDGNTIILEEGDSVYFPSKCTQSWKGLGTEPIEVLIVMTPPWF